MQTNVLPQIDMSDIPTGCCPRFQPEGWEGQDLHFQDKRFLRATTLSAMHIPLNMGRVFGRVQAAIEQQGAALDSGYFVMTLESSPWGAEHYFAVARDVEGEQMISLTGDYMTKVFEGPFRDAGKWHEAMLDAAREAGKEPGKVYFFYTTCPKCAKVYGQNYVVGLVEV